jgi:hypothetical protein
MVLGGLDFRFRQCLVAHATHQPLHGFNSRHQSKAKWKCSYRCQFLHRRLQQIVGRFRHQDEDFRGSAYAFVSIFTRRICSPERRLWIAQQPGVVLNTPMNGNVTTEAWSAKEQQLHRRGWSAADKPSKPRRAGSRSRSNQFKARTRRSTIATERYNVRLDVFSDH